MIFKKFHFSNSQVISCFFRRFLRKSSKYEYYLKINYIKFSLIKKYVIFLCQFETLSQYKIILFNDIYLMD